ncbi:MAG: PAS domain S-box protein, partial [Gammaproteobacteria bacterium]|nr:PAS domain S-box protein [Gammaproteobacteria bacterium]
MSHDQDQEQHSAGNTTDQQDLRIIEQIEDILWACDLNLKFTYLSPVTEKNSGYSAEERKQLNLEKTLTSSSAGIVNTLIKKNSAIVKKPEDGPDTPVRCLLDIYRKDGSTYPVEASISLIRNKQGVLTGLAGSNRNITEIVRAETIIKAIHDGSIHSTGEQYLNNLVRQLSTILNQRYTFIAQINKGISQTRAFCKDGEIAENFSYSLKGSPCENVVAGGICYYPKDAAKTFPHEAGMQRMGVESYIGTPIPDAKGKVQGLLVIMHDQPMEDIPLLRRVLEVCADRVGAEMSRREVQSKLEESEQRFRTLFELSVDPCLIHDTQGRIINSNQSMSRAFAYSTEELRDINAIELVSPEPGIEATYLTGLENVMATGSSRVETRLQCKSGEIFRAEVSSQLINIDGKELIQSVIRDMTEQHRLLEEEKNKQQTLARLFDDLHTFILILNIDGSVSYSNTTPLSNPDAYQAEQLATKVWEYQAFSHNPVMQAIMKADIAAAIQGQQTQNDLQILTPEGLLWVQANIHPMHDSKGNITQLLIEGTNIDQRKKMAEELLHTEQRRQLFREQAPMPVVEWSIDTYSVSGWNDAAKDLFGFTFEEVMGQPPEFLTPQGINVDKKDIHYALTSTHHKIISKNRCNDGRIILCEWYNSPIKDSSGNLIAVISIVRDITLEHQAQQILLNRDTEHQEILNTILDAVFTLDEAGEILSFNHAAEKLFGYTPCDIIGESCWQLIPQQYQKRHSYYMQRFLETGDQQYLGVSDGIEGLRKDGSTFPSRMAIAALSKDNRKQQQFIVSMQDLSHIQQQEEQLRRSQKMDALGKLTGGIAHDFNNMLGVIMGYADLLQAATQDQPKLEKYAHEIFRAGERGAQLTEKLLGFSRQKIAAAEQLSINATLQNQKHMLAKSITPRITLVYDLAEDLWLTYIDNGDLSDAVLNISINAMHAMHEGGQLSIATRNEHINEFDAALKGLSQGDYVLLSISDTGCGMDQETQEKIFDPFFSTKGELGTGLGLSQVYGFVERSKGSIKIYSKPGQGTRLSLYFPRHHDIDATANN